MEKQHDIIEPDDARALLQSTQQLRTHWSGVITTHIGYIIVVNVAIWSYFLKSYIDSLTASSTTQPSYIVLAAAISAVTLGAWRLYTHYIDNHIAGLYPDFLLYEGILSVPSDHQTSGYLIRAVPRLDLILLDNDLTPAQKLEAIATLVKSRRIGNRGHLPFDLSTLAIVLVMFVVSLILRSELQSFLAVGCLTVISIGLLFVLLGLFGYQRNPSKRFIEKVLSELKGTGGSGG